MINEDKKKARYKRYRDKLNKDPERLSKHRKVFNDRRAERKKILVEYKGGKCERCGYDRCLQALDFHHLDPVTKDFHITRGSSIELLMKEVDKCILVCANCHREIHHNFVATPHCRRIASPLAYIIKNEPLLTWTL